MEPQIRFCTTSDGVRIAYAISGEGLPLVRVLGWFTHLEFDFKNPLSGAFIDALSANHLFVQYDGRGMGLSDRQVNDYSLEAQVFDLEAVVDSIGLERFALYGMSQGGPTAMTYAARNPDRVSHLILFGTFARPWWLKSEAGKEEFNALQTLIRTGWSSDAPAHRQFFTSLFMPDADADSMRAFNELQKISSTAESASKLFTQMFDLDVTPHLAKIKAPTLVIHLRDDAAVPFKVGRDLAAAIPGARFLALEGTNHSIARGVPREPAVDLLINGINEFTGVLEEGRVVESGPPPLANTEMIGTTISHYKILEKLGEGGMGVVYKAEDTRLERTIALKFLTPQAVGSEEDKARFFLEAKAAAKLDHTNICTIYEIDEAEGQTFIVMAYVNGQSLEEKLESGHLEIGEALIIALQVAEGLKEAHAKGIIHRDIKAANIMVSPDGQAKIMDFGLAKLAGRSRLTKTATIMGTVAYMSPEQASGEATIDHRTDIWSLGVVLYKMLTAYPPFDAPSDAALIHKIIYEEMKPVSSFRSDIPSAVEDIIQKMLRKNPQERYQDMQSLIADLRFARTGKVAVEKKASPSIAVLPFVDMSPHKDQEYFCDGIAEELINALTQVKDLRVIARTSAFSFKGEKVGVDEIGRKLKVQTVLEGSVRKAGNRLRITAQLVDTTGGHHLWSDRYDRELDDIFAIQDEITLAIVDNLKPMLLGEERARIAKRQAVNLDAHNLYLQGRFFWNKQTGTGHKKAIEFFERAVQKEPEYAQAWSGIADSYGQIPFYSFSRPREIYPKARDAALKAIKINDSLAEGHASLGYVKTAYERDWKNAEREYERAIELNPGYAFTRFSYCWHLIFMGRYDEAIEQIERALELDPLSVVINRDLGIAHSFAGKYEQAVEALKKTIAMDVSFPLVHYMLGMTYIYSSRHEEAANEFERELRYMGDPDPMRELFVGYGLAFCGNLQKAAEMRDRMLEEWKSGYVSPYLLGTIYIAMGDHDEGFTWLEKAYEEMDPLLGLIKPQKELQHIHSDPRYIALLKKMGLEP